MMTQTGYSFSWTTITTMITDDSTTTLGDAIFDEPRKRHGMFYLMFNYDGHYDVYYDDQLRSSSTAIHATSMFQYPDIFYCI